MPGQNPRNVSKLSAAALALAAATLVLGAGVTAQEAIGLRPAGATARPVPALGRREAPAPSSPPARRAVRPGRRQSVATASRPAVPSRVGSGPRPLRQTWRERCGPSPARSRGASLAAAPARRRGGPLRACRLSGRQCRVVPGGWTERRLRQQPEPHRGRQKGLRRPSHGGRVAPAKRLVAARAERASARRLQRLPERQERRPA